MREVRRDEGMEQFIIWTNFLGGLLFFVFCFLFPNKKKVIIKMKEKNLWAQGNSLAGMKLLISSFQLEVNKKEML